MFGPPLKLADTRILVTNDDGINAPGLKILERVARSLSRDVWVVAPESEQSGAAHSLTLSRPLRHRRITRRRHAVDGSPTDCVLFAIKEVLSDRKPDLVLSGVNRGGNLGEDVTYSGTVAAAMEGTLLGVRSIALSQIYARDEDVPWNTAEHYAPGVIENLVGIEWPSDVFMNVNFPNRKASDVAGIRIVPQGRRESDYNLVGLTDPRGNRYYWIGPPKPGDLLREGDTDHHVIDEGAVSVTPLHVDLTHNATIPTLRKIFGG